MRAACIGYRMPTIMSYGDLDAWKLGMTLTEAIDELTYQFPREERYGLTPQLRRAAAGIPSHVSEGHRHGTRSYRHFVILALGCQAKCETQLELSLRLKLAEAAEIQPVMEPAARVGQVLHGLARSLPEQ